METGHCKVFIETEDVGRNMDLSLLESYDELYRKLADMFSIKKSEMLSRVIYRDVVGAVKHIGYEPFSDFTRTARRLTILMEHYAATKWSTMQRQSGAYCIKEFYML